MSSKENNKTQKISRIKVYCKFGSPYDSQSPEKCTASLCISKGLIEEVKEIPKHSVLLYPFAEEPLTKDDRKLAERNGLYVIDAPWETLPYIVGNLNKTIKLRRLTNIEEVSGIYAGSTYKISTAGAVAAALFKLELREQAEEILNNFKWKNVFVRKNLKE